MHELNHYFFCPCLPLPFSGDLCQEKYDRKKFYVAEEVYPGESPSVFQCYLAETCDASKLIPDQLVGKENMRKQCGFHSRMPKHFPVIPDPSKTKQVGRHQEVYKLWLGSIYHDWSFGYLRWALGPSSCRTWSFVNSCEVHDQGWLASSIDVSKITHLDV